MSPELQSAIDEIALLTTEVENLKHDNERMLDDLCVYINLLDVCRQEKKDVRKRKNGRSKYKRCLGCNELMEIRPPKTRSSKKYCGAACKMRYIRGQQKDEG